MSKTLTKIHSCRHHVFSSDYLQELRSQILLSPYLNTSQLSTSFAGTKGFSIVFQRSSIERVEKHFPFLKLYLQSTLKSSCNAFYCNVLILENGGEVTEHTDCSIATYDMIYTNPRLVSVFYVDVPQDIQGGELVIKQGSESLAVKPQTNTLVFFLGHLIHQVNQVKSTQSRISLVCEQYSLSSQRLANIPEFKIESDALPKA